MIVLFVLTILFVTLVLNGLFKLSPEITSYVLYLAAPLVAIGGGYVIYANLFKFFRKKVDMDKYFEPLFKKKR
jgi:hypothetical protein